MFIYLLIQMQKNNNRCGRLLKPVLITDKNADNVPNVVLILKRRGYPPNLLKSNCNLIYFYLKYQ